jgi:hypothetical protein
MKSGLGDKKRDVIAVKTTGSVEVRKRSINRHKVVGVSGYWIREVSFDLNAEYRPGLRSRSSRTGSESSRSRRNEPCREEAGIVRAMTHDYASAVRTVSHVIVGRTIDSGDCDCRTATMRKCIKGLKSCKKVIFQDLIASNSANTIEKLRSWGTTKLKDSQNDSTFEHRVRSRCLLSQIASSRTSRLRLISLS